MSEHDGDQSTPTAAGWGGARPEVPRGWADADPATAVQPTPQPQPSPPPWTPPYAAPSYAAPSYAAPSAAAPSSAAPPRAAQQPPAQGWGQQPAAGHNWQQPGYAAPAAPNHWTPNDQQPAPWAARPAARRSRKPLVLGLSALLVVLLAGGGLFLLLRDHPLTWDGRTVAQPEKVLSDAETQLAEYVQGRNGSTSDDAHCWFQLTAKDSTDVADELVCGPALFVDGDPTAQYLFFGLTAPTGDDDDVTLTVADEPTSPDPAALPDRELLTRPDGVTPPEGAGGLSVPEPPLAEPGYSAEGAFADVDYTAPDGPAAMVGPAARVTILGLAQLDRVGTGDEAVRPADGEQFIAVEYALAPGAGAANTAPSLSYVVQGEDPIEVEPALVSPGATIQAVVSVPEGATAVLQSVDGGYTQSLSLTDGTPDPGNIAVLVRANTEQTIAATQQIVGSGTSPGLPVSTPVTLSVTLTSVQLAWFPGADVTAVPSSPGNAFLILDDSGDTGLPGSTVGRSPSSLWQLQLPDGSLLPSRDLVDDPTLVATAFEVPADFTTGTLVFGGVGTYVDGGMIDFSGATISFPVSIPAG